MSHRHLSALLPLLGVAAVALAPASTAEASSATDEFLTLTGYVEPNIIFVLDLSSSMDDPCVADTSGGTDPSYDERPCIEVAIDAINQIALHYDWARYGVVGTTESDSDDSFFPVVPLGSTQAELTTALEALTTHGTDTRNLSEALAALADDYLSITIPDDGVDDDGDGLTGDWDEAPIEYSCQETHLIVLTKDRPVDDEDVTSGYEASISPDIKCATSTSAASSGVDRQCKYDNVAYSLYDSDMRYDLSGEQAAIVHTIAMGVEEDSAGDELFANASDVIDGTGLYANVESSDEVLGGMMTVLRDIRAGVYSRSTPVISADGSHLIFSFYEITGDNPLAEGHVRSYEIEDDPASSRYGQVLYDGPTEFGGAIWDAGDLLVSRPVTAGESNPDDRDGFGKRDIYTYFTEAAALMPVETTGDRRQGLDYEFVFAVGATASTIDLILDTTSSVAPPCGDDPSYDLNDDCMVDEDDLQALVDFVRGLPEAEYRYLGMERGRWKLGDSPNSVPVVVQKRNNAFTVDPTYRSFLKLMEESDVPDIVLIAANDGMLHAFQLDDDLATSDTEEGEELWAWIPGYLLYREHDAEWAGRLLDMMLYGRTFLFDGTPVVEDVWIDADEDGVKECTSLDDCEWRRIVVVQQGKGGPVTLSLDITDPTAPTFLWEQTDETDFSAMGYTVSRPVIANVYHAEGSSPSEWRDRWVAMWGSGRAVPFSKSVSYYESAEANLYMWHVGDDVWGTSDVAFTDHGDNGHPESASYSASLDSDGDGHYEYGYISAALAVVDVDSDGDADTVYFPVTASYSPTDEGGGGPGDIQDPGATWMYKACINTNDPDDLTWVEFYDPVDDGGLAKRPEVYYAATTSWHYDGSLGLYWGSGSPYTQDTTSEGYFFAVKDYDPMFCTIDSMRPIEDCGAEGVYALEPGESMTGDPIIYAGVVYFSTWTPYEDLCDGGQGRVYGLKFDDCSAGFDTDGDGDADEDDLPFVEVDGYPSAVTVTEMGTLMVGTSSPIVDGSDDAVLTINAVTDPFLGTATLAWMEVF